MLIISSPVATRSLNVESTGSVPPTVHWWYTRAFPSAADVKIFFQSPMSPENPFLFGVTIEIPLLRIIGYARAISGFEVLSIRIAGPGAAARYSAISYGLRLPLCIRKSFCIADFQLDIGIDGEYSGKGAKSVRDDRARRTRLGGVWSFPSCSKNAFPTTPTPVA